MSNSEPVKYLFRIHGPLCSLVALILKSIWIWEWQAHSSWYSLCSHDSREQLEEKRWCRLTSCCYCFCTPWLSLPATEAQDFSSSFTLTWLISLSLYISCTMGESLLSFPTSVFCLWLIRLEIRLQIILDLVTKHLIGITKDTVAHSSKIITLRNHPLLIFFTRCKLVSSYHLRYTLTNHGPRAQFRVGELLLGSCTPEESGSSR